LESLTDKEKKILLLVYTDRSYKNICIVLP